MNGHDIEHIEAEPYWEDFYGKKEQVWSGNPNAVLVREITGRAPGTALDLGCGEGGDAIWLAQQGWRVTAVDVSRTALRRGQARAESTGVSALIDWQQHDLTVSFPPGTFDLVSAQFLHSPMEFPRDRVLQAATEAVAPGGRLLIVGHAGMPPWSKHHHPEVSLPSPQEVLESLQLPPEQWRVEVLESPERVAIGPEGQTATLTDSVLSLTRVTLPSPSTSPDR